MPELSTPSGQAAGQPIDYDLRCWSCDYNLRGLMPEGNCPECGTPIMQTVRGGLNNCDPRWLRRLAWGVGLMFVLPFLLFLALFVTLIDWQWQLLAITISYAAGLWLISQRQPAVASRDGRLRVLVRIGAVALVSIALLDAAVGELDFPGWPSADTRVLGTVFVALVPTLFCSFWLLFRLARRIPNARLARHAVAAMWLTPAFQAAFLAVALLDSYMGKIGDAVGMYMLAMAILAASWSNLVLGRFQQAFSQAAAAAQARKAASPGREAL